MTKEKQVAIAAIDDNADLIVGLSDRIWEYAELSLQEEKSAEDMCCTLEQLGFTVERGVCNIATAFTASYGSGRPIIGLLAEYDALSGLSQKASGLAAEPLVPDGNGHGCGHNLLGTGSVAAAIGVKAYLETSGRSGTVILFGCPGEEGVASKAFMARENIWRKLDAALTWHPSDTNEVVTGSSNACIQNLYQFTGVASHAAFSPDHGRSALDAVELMNLGVQFLREHMPDKARIHYAITDTGGCSPNVVQAKASVLYMVRANHISEAIELQKRVDQIAEGAALMTETTWKKIFVDGLSNVVPNHTLETVLYRNFEELGVPGYTDEEHAFADALAKTYDGSNGLPGIAAANSCDAAAQVKAMRASHGNHALNDFLAPLYQGSAYDPGSTDVGDTSWECPTAQIHVVTWPNGCPGHSWQNVSCGHSSLGHKGLLHAGRVLAASVIDLIENPALIEQAQSEFDQQTAEGYMCPIPADAVATILN